MTIRKSVIDLLNGRIYKVLLTKNVTLFVKYF
ncbi:hypothetical protein SAMN05444266_105286 [Chitinophaga jiangningensis]|uniref:Uncharacterized protein n=1 Tax=Chitinophaga jiangningensis TaxID=1419482 RepID=A0A1M7E668_9BACT|nr:hypothetical protein SAMN05444266_105286 [Chitinophaga jiangningensis]